MSRLQAEARRNKELLDSRYKSNKDEMVSSIGSIKELTEKNYELVRKTNSIESELSEKSAELRRKEEMVTQLREEIRSVNKEKDGRFNNLMNEFKRLEETLNKSALDNQSGLKSTILNMENTIRAEQNEKERFRLMIAEVTQKSERLAVNLAEEKRITEDLREKLKV